MKELSASGLADLAGTTTVEVQRLVEHPGGPAVVRLPGGLAVAALLGIYRRQQELSWTEHLVERSRTSSRRPACWDGQSG